VAAVEQSGYGVITDQVDFAIMGMTCASCVNWVEKALKKADGVLEASVNLATERAIVAYTPDVVDFSSPQAADVVASVADDELLQLVASVELE
jgi:P-type Cu+ transporter